MELGVVTTPSLNNPDVGDLALTEQQLETVVTTLADQVAQRLYVRLNFFKAEWFLNLEAGTPWYQSILVKGPTDHVIRSVFTQVIQGTEGVQELVSLTYTVSKATRQLAITFKARLYDGTTFVSTDYAPFVVVQ